MQNRAVTFAILLAGVFAVSVVSYANLGGPDGVRIPYSGFLERDGVPLTGEVDLSFDVFGEEVGGTACDGQTLVDVSVVAGRFAVVIGPVAEACVKNRDVFLEIGIDDGTGFSVLGGRSLVTPSIAAYTSGKSGDFDVAGAITASGAISSSGNVTGSAGVVGQNARIGEVGFGPLFAGFSHANHADSANFALAAKNDASVTLVNTSAVGSIQFSSGGTTRMQMNNAGDLQVFGGDIDLRGGRLLPDYDSGWFAIGLGANTRLVHGLGTIPLRYTILVATGPNGTGDVSLGGYQWLFGVEEESRGVVITGVSSESLRVRSGKDYIVDTYGLGGPRIFDTSGSVRVYAWR